MSLLLHGLSINTYYSSIIVISCTLVINKVPQTRCSSMYFFLLTQCTALKVLFQQLWTWTSIFSFYCLDSEKTFRARQPRWWCFFWLVWFIPEIPEQTSDWEWHKTSRSRVHHAKIHLIILHLPTFFMGFFLWVSPRNAWGQDRWIDRDKWCVLKVRQYIWSLSYFKIHVVVLVHFRSDATSKTVPECIRQPYARSDRRTKKLPSISQFG